MHRMVVSQVRQTGRAFARPVLQTGHRWRWRRSACGITPVRITGVLVIVIIIIVFCIYCFYFKRSYLW